MAITTEINIAIADHNRITGEDAKTVYLGRKQMRLLLQWAYKCGYLAAYDPACIEGKERPDYQGRKVYEVNDDDHLGVA